MRNIHFSKFSAADDVTRVYAGDPTVCQEKATKTSDEIRLKLRTVAVSPAEEYALRPGTVEPIPDSMAALILSRGGRVEVTLKGVVVDRKDMGGRHTYWHPDSRVCSDLSARSRKIFYVINIYRPEVVHLLDETGAYIESLPLKNRPAVLDNAAQEKEARANARAIRRVSKHMQDIHAPDTAAALEALSHNAAATGRAFTQTLPALPVSDRAEPVQPARSELGDTIAAAERDVCADTAHYDRSPLPSVTTRRTARQTVVASEASESAASILGRRIELQVDCPY